MITFYSSYSSFIRLAGKQAHMFKVFVSSEQLLCGPWDALRTAAVHLSIRPSVRLYRDRKYKREGRI